MRSALGGLTTRGRCFVAAGVAAAVSALILGESDLLRVAVLLVAVPLLSAVAVARTRYQLHCSRVLHPHRMAPGGTARVVMRLRNVSRLPTGTLLLEDQLPYALGSRPRLVLERLPGHRASSVAYTVRADVRGRYTVGPLVIRITDPFGLCELTRHFPAVDTLTVLPRVVPLEPVRLAGEFGGSGDSRTRSVAVHGEDDVATREYRHGDDLRRVHWRSTAKAGELMVRREEQPWESRATIVLDTRLRGHRGEGPGGSFEWAVSAAASIAVHLRNSGYRLRLVTDTGTDIGTGNSENGSDSADEILDHLAGVALGQRGDLVRMSRRMRLGEDAGLIIAVLGMLSADEAEAVAELRTSGTTCVGFLLDAASWQRLPQAQRARHERDYQASALGLVRGGWRVVAAPHGRRFAALWPQAARGTRGFAPPADTTAGSPR